MTGMDRFHDIPDLGEETGGSNPFLQELGYSKVSRLV